MSGLTDMLRRSWYAFNLPEHRECRRTYCHFGYDELPPAPKELDAGFGWLLRQPVHAYSLADAGEVEDDDGNPIEGSKPDLGRLDEFERSVRAPLPRPFQAFIRSPDLQRRVRSCTECFLDLADRPVGTTGSEEGSLIHFLSDQQWCAHWYLYVSASGEHCVLASNEAFGFVPEPGSSADPRTEIELAREDVWFCAPTFVEFVWRFWIENEIWFALKGSRVPLTPEQNLYLSYYPQGATPTG